MNLLSRLTGTTANRSASPSWDEWQDFMSFAGQNYPLSLQPSVPGSAAVSVDGSFASHVTQIHERHGIVSACVLARGLLMSQLRFAWRDVVAGLDSQTFGTPDLLPLEQPGHGVTRPRLLMQAEQHVSYSGAAFFYRTPMGIKLLRPDWVSVLIGSDQDEEEAATQLDGEVVGYVYRPNGRGDGTVITPGEIAHWVPEPDPLNPWRGESWVRSVIQEILTDQQSTDHLSKFFTNAATPNMVFSFDAKVSAEKIRKFADVVNMDHAGAANGYKNLFMGGGATPMVVGSKIADLDYRNVQGGNETRIAARARIPASILGIREGLAGSALNAGNYTAARRAWSDGWFSPTADGLCAALQTIVPSPRDAVELTYKANAIAFLQDDRLDESNIRSRDALTMESLIRGGYTPDSVREAVSRGDFSLLKHSGLVSVQLQPPGTVAKPVSPDTPTEAPE